MAKFKVYHVDSRPERQPHTAEAEQLAKADAELISLTLEQQQDIPAHVTDADGIICGYRHVGKDVFDAAPNLKVVVRYGIGFDNIDWQTAVDYGIDRLQHHRLLHQRSSDARNLVAAGAQSEAGRAQTTPPAPASAFRSDHPAPSTARPSAWSRLATSPSRPRFARRRSD